MNILVAIERLKEIAQSHQDAIIQGFDYISEDFAHAANVIAVQSCQVDGNTRVYFEYDEKSRSGEGEQSKG